MNFDYLNSDCATRKPSVAYDITVACHMLEVTRFLEAYFEDHLWRKLLPS